MKANLRRRTAPWSRRGKRIRADSGISWPSNFGQEAVLCASAAPTSCRRSR